MKALNLAFVAREAFVAYGRNPILLIPALILFGAMFLVRGLSLWILPYLQTNTTNVLWSIFATLLQLLILAYCFSALLVLVKGITHKGNLSVWFVIATARQRAFPCFILLALTLLAFMLLNWLALSLGKFALSLSDSAGLVTFIIIWILGFAGGMIFLAFANVLCVAQSLSICASIRESAHIVKRNYFLILLLSMVLFIILATLEKFIPKLIAELIKSFVILPYLVLFLVFFCHKTLRVLTPH